MKEIDFLKENVSVGEYLLHHTNVGDHCDIYDGGYYCASFIIDCEDLFARNLNRELAKTYIDRDVFEERTITDKREGQEPKTFTCRHVIIYIGEKTYTLTDNYRIKMKVNDSEYIYTKWFKDYVEKDGLTKEEAHKKIWEDYDKMLESYGNWSRKEEYERKEYSR